MVHLKKGADGHLLKNAAGHLVRVCEMPVDCELCDNDYYEYEIVISGSTVCDSGKCFKKDVVGTWWSGSNDGVMPDIDGTYIVPFVGIEPGSICVWRYLEAYTGGVRHTRWTGVSDCSGAPTYGPDDYTHLMVQLIKKDLTHWSFDAGFILDGHPASGWPCFHSFWVLDKVVASGNCEGWADNNYWTTCQVENECCLRCWANGGAIGGSVTVTPIT